ncbi:hypothetical protein GCK32_006029 [Trichostrongylus colubriformis]|uniref:G-protein coupled receptors family 1 profile domain-containing protein n=1 Tax=Trichostrongylus colubriformis TaxID=6319 RepID=A0AAN8G484_TRICO
MNQNRSDQIIAGAVMVTISIIGNVLNISAVILIYRTPSFHNAFGFICTSTLLADIGVLVVFLGWCAPSVLIGFSEEFLEGYIDEVVGQLIMLFWYASIYGHLLLALNRLVAIIRPIKYNSMFSNRRVIYILAAFWLFCLLVVTVYFFEECNFTFDPDTFVWDYAETVCGQIISFYVDLVHGTVVCVMIILIDTIAFCAIVKKYKRLLRSSVGLTEATKLKQNVRLYVQVSS